MLLGLLYLLASVVVAAACAINSTGVPPLLVILVGAKPRGHHFSTIVNIRKPRRRLTGVFASLCHKSGMQDFCVRTRGA
jgi:hypothetical protein